MVDMKKKKDATKQARVLEYRAAISKKKNNPFAFILDLILLGVLAAALYLGFTNFGPTLDDYNAKLMMRYIGLGALGGGFVLSYLFSFIFHKSKNSQNFRDRAWMFLLTAAVYYGYMATYDFFIAGSTEPMIKLLPTFLLIIPPFMIAFLAGRGHVTTVGTLSHFVLITAYLYATFQVNYVSEVTSFQNVLLLVRSTEQAEEMLLMIHDWVYVASLIGTAHFFMMRGKYAGWQNIFYVVFGLISLGHTGLFITNEVMLLMKENFDFTVLLGDTLIPAVAAVFSLLFAFIELFGRDLEKKYAKNWAFSIIAFIFAAIFIVGGLFGVPYALALPLFQEEMYVYLGYGVLLYALMLGTLFALVGINTILRYIDSKWILDKKAEIPAENRAVLFSGNSKPNMDFVLWSKGLKAKIAKDNRHLFAVETPEEYTVDAKKQIFLRYILALVDVNKKDYRLLYMGKVYYASPSRIDPQTGRPVVSLENDAKLSKKLGKTEEKPEKKEVKKEVKKERSPMSVIEPEKAHASAATLAPAPKDEEEEVKEEAPVRANPNVPLAEEDDESPEEEAPAPSKKPSAIDRLAEYNKTIK